MAGRTEKRSGYVYQFSVLQAAETWLRAPKLVLLKLLYYRIFETVNLARVGISRTNPPCGTVAISTD
jgi:hypothetical protein